MRKFILWGPALIFLVVISAIVLQEFGLGANSARLEITNRSAIEITDIRVSIYAKRCEFERLRPGDSVVCDLAIETDGNYTITWSEASAGNFSEQAGYVTHGFDFNYELDFLGDGKIDFDFSEVF